MSFMKETRFSTMTNILSSEIPCNLTLHFENYTFSIFNLILRVPGNTTASYFKYITILYSNTFLDW